MTAPAEHPRPAPPFVAGVVLLVVGALALFAAIVGYALAPERLSGWDRLSEGNSFGLPSPAVGIAGVVLLVIGLVLLGVALGSARHRDRQA